MSKNLRATIERATESGEVGVTVDHQVADVGRSWVITIASLQAAFADIRALRAAFCALGFKSGQVSRNEDGALYFPLSPACRPKAQLPKGGLELPSGGPTEGEGDDQPTPDDVRLTPVAIDKIVSGPATIVAGGQEFDWAGLALGLQRPRESAAPLLDLRRVDSPEVIFCSTQRGDLIRVDDPEGCEPGTLVSASGGRETIRLVKPTSSQPSLFERIGETEEADDDR